MLNALDGGQGRRSHCTLCQCCGLPTYRLPSQQSAHAQWWPPSLAPPWLLCVPARVYMGAKTRTDACFGGVPWDSFPMLAPAPPPCLCLGVKVPAHPLARVAPNFSRHILSTQRPSTPLKRHFARPPRALGPFSAGQVAPGLRYHLGVSIPHPSNCPTIELHRPTRAPRSCLWTSPTSAGRQCAAGRLTST